jgi:hypothetical protein
MELGRRGRKFLDHFGNHAQKLETLANFFDPGVPKLDPPEDVWPFDFRVDGPDFGKSRYILRWGPATFTGVYAILAIITYCTK